MNKIAQLLAIISNFIFKKIEIKHLTKAYFERVNGFVKIQIKSPQNFACIFIDIQRQAWHNACPRSVVTENLFIFVAY
ncbi:MAG: hypothetical protein LBS50_05340 [Prevotellaceae bacterium]|jgi:hypothetical protein|nr:hypothetical protein [Prevotellaceae bacterium]